MASFLGINIKPRFSWQIIALITAGLFLLAVTGSFASAYFINKKLSNVLMEQGRQITSTLAHQSILSLLSGVGGNVQEDVNSTLSHPNVISVAIYNRSGELLLSAGSREPHNVTQFPVSSAPYEAVLMRSSNASWEFMASVYDTDISKEQQTSGLEGLFAPKPVLLGYVHVAIDRTSIFAMQKSLLNDSLAIFCLVALVLVAFAVFFSRQITMPLHDLAGLMKQAEEGKEEIRAPLRGPAEVNSMAQAFNTMMKALEQRQIYAEEQHNSLLKEIRERQLIEQELRDSEHRLVSIFNNVIDGILILNNRGRIEFANPASERLLNYEGGATGHDLCQVLKDLSSSHNASYPEEISELLEKSARDSHLSIFSGSYPIEIEIKFSDMVINENKKYITIIRDITETQAQKNKIEELLAQHEAIVSSVPGMILEVNRDGKLLWCNKETEDLLKTPFIRLLNSQIAGIIEEEEQSQFKESLNTAFSTGQSEVHANVLVKDEAVPYQFNVAKMAATTEEDSSLLIVGLDDSQSIMAQKALQSARDTALETARIKSEFLANMSHEIRTPMNGLVGMLQLLSDTELTKTQKEYSDIALKSADQLMTIINDILDFSKIEAGKLDIKHIEYSPRTIIEDVVDLFYMRAKEKNIALYSFVSPDVPDVVCGDPARITQIISNLLSNAVKFTNAGHVFVSCNVVAVGDNGGVSNLVIEVEDTGIGIDYEGQAKLFESFVQLDGSSTRRFSGTGLGLAIVKQLSDLMKGSIKLQSIPNQGSTFTLTLPLKRGDVINPSSLIPSDIKSEKRAVYVGQERIFYYVLREYMQAFGVSVEMCSSILQLEDELLLKANYLLIESSQFDHNAKTKLEKATSSEVRIIYDRGDDLLSNLEDIKFPFSYIERPIRLSTIREMLTSFGEKTLPKDNGSSFTVPVEDEKMGGSDVNILIVEDNDTNLKVINSMLGKLGYNPISVSNGAEAVEKVVNEDFDVVFMDCQMPVMDGYQATSEIRNIESKTNGNHLTIIAMTGNAMEGDREKCLASGMDDYISKPIRFALLKQTLSKWLEHKVS